ALSTHRIGDETCVLSLFEKSPRPFGGKPARHLEASVRRVLRELRDVADALQDAFHAALERAPLESGDAGNRAEAQHETVGERGAQQRLRRPQVPWAAEFGRRGRCDLGQSWRREGDRALWLSACGRFVNMWIGMHCRLRACEWSWSYYV